MEKSENMSISVTNTNYNLRLPNDFLIQTFEYLPFDRLACVNRVCKHWNNLANSNVLWKHLFEKKFPCLLYKKTPSSWKTLYANLSVTKNHQIICEKTLENPGANVTCLAIGENVFAASYLSDSAIYIWDLKGQLLREIKDAHKMWIESLAIQGNKLISGGLDGFVKVWNLENGEKLLEKRGYKDSMGPIAIEGDQIVSIEDRSISLGNLKNDASFSLLCPTQDSVHTGALALQGNRAVWGPFNGGECKVKIYDLAKKTLSFMSPPHHTNAIHCIAIQGDKAFSGSYDGTLKIWDLKTTKCLHTLSTNSKGEIRVLSVRIQGNIIVAGYEDGTIRIWDLNTQTVLHTLKEHKKRVESIVIHGDTIVSGGWLGDGSIKIWKIKK